MKKIKNIFLIILCLIINNLFGEDTTLENKLLEINKIKNDRNYDLNLFEEKCKALLIEYTSPEDRGKIYYNIVCSYSIRRGYEEKIKKYCEKSLEYPLDLPQKLDVYSKLGVAYMCRPERTMAVTEYVLNNECIESRKKAISIWIEGLNLLKEYNLPDDEQKLPVCNEIISYATSDENDPILKKIEEDNIKYVKEMERVKSENKLIMLRNRLYNYCITVYSTKPYANEEFYEIMLDGLKDEITAKKLLERLNEKIKYNEESWKRLKNK
jgi:hypothetical protein